MKMKFWCQSSRFTACLLAATLGLAARAWADPAPAAAWRVAVVGYQRPAGTMSVPIPSALKTELAAAVSGEKGALTLMSKGDFDGLGITWQEFKAQAAKGGSADLAQVKPEWIRDRNQVIECGILRASSPSGDITPILLAPDFIKRFAPVFGKKILVAVPDRRTLFLFPRLASKYQDYGEKVLSVYKKSDCPVSREVLELSDTGLRAIGEYEN